MKTWCWVGARSSCWSHGGSTSTFSYLGPTGWVLCPYLSLYLKPRVKLQTLNPTLCASEVAHDFGLLQGKSGFLTSSGDGTKNGFASIRTCLTLSQKNKYFSLATSSLRSWFRAIMHFGILMLLFLIHIIILSFVFCCLSNFCKSDASSNTVISSAYCLHKYAL